MIQDIIFGNGGTFHPGLPYLDNFDKGTPSGFFLRCLSLFWYQET